MKVGAISVETEGDSKSKLAILLPGLLDGKNYPHFKHFSKALAKQGFLVVRFDPRGTGESDGGIEDYSRRNFLRDVSDLIDHFGGGYEQIVLIGHSFGGANAILSASQDPRVTNVIATAPPPSMRRIDNAETIAKWERNGFRESDRINDDGTTRHYSLPISFLHDAEKFDVIAAISGVKAATLLIACRNDDTVDPESVKGLGKGLPNATVRELDVGHDYWQPQNKKELDLVTSEILEWLK